MMYSGFLCSALASVAFLLLAVPASNAAESLPLSPGPGVSAARALVRAGRFVEALTDLRPLLQAHPGRTDILFLTGLAAIEAAQKPDTPESDRQALLDEAIASLRTILTNRPGLVRVRLELARAFFLKGEDSLARGHFERVLAGKPPAPVVANVQRFLAEIRARRRWTMYLGAAMSPDSNIGGASDEQIIYINDLPFRRDAEELTTSGIGVSVWTGGEYQHPLGDRLRLRLGGDLSRQDYGGKQVRSDLCVGSCGPALAGRQRYRGQPGRQRPPPLDRHGSLPRRSRRPDRSRAPADPADRVFAPSAGGPQAGPLQGNHRRPS